MADIIQLQFIWENINYVNPLMVQKYFEKHQSSLVEFIIEKTLEKEKFEIGTFASGWHEGSVITYSENENRKKLELRLKKNNSFEILLSIKRDNEGQQVFRQKLTSADIKLIPQHLSKLMHNIKELKTSATFFNSAASQ